MGKSQSKIKPPSRLTSETDLSNKVNLAGKGECLVTAKAHHKATKYEDFQACIRTLPEDLKAAFLQISSAEIEKALSYVEYVLDQDVIIKGQKGEGLYYLISGELEVLSQNGNDSYVTLYPGSWIGEVSLMFNIPCTVHIRAKTKCTMMFLEKSALMKKLKSIKVPITDWFVFRRYLPLAPRGTGATSTQIKIKMIKTCLQRVPLFYGWNSDALDYLAITVKHVVYGQRMILIHEGDIGHQMYIVLRGRCGIAVNKKMLCTIHVEDDPLVIAEEAIFIGTPSLITVFSEGCTQILQITREVLEDAQVLHPKFTSNMWMERERKWVNFFTNQQKLNKELLKEPCMLQSEVLYQKLKLASSLASCSAGFLDHLVLHSKPLHFNKGDPVCIVQNSNCAALLVLDGELQLRRNNQNFHEPGDVIPLHGIFWKCDWMEGLSIVANKISLVIKVSTEALQKGLNLYPDTQINFPTAENFIKN